MRPATILAAALASLALAAPAALAEKGGNTRTSGFFDEPIVVVNGDVLVERGESVEGVFVVHGFVNVGGRVTGDVVVVSGDVYVTGRIEGDLVTIAERARLAPGARVDGDIHYGEGPPVIAPRATVGGEVSKEDWLDSVDLLPFVGAFVFWLAVSVSAALLGILLLLVGPRAADAVFDRARERIGPVIAIGLAIFVVLPLAAFLAAITLVGLPLAIGIGLALLPLASIAYVTSAWALGRVIVKPPRERILAFLAGLAILRAAALVPILGLVVWLGAVIVGLGLLGAAIGAARKEPAEPAAPG